MIFSFYKKLTFPVKARPILLSVSGVGNAFGPSGLESHLV